MRISLRIIVILFIFASSLFGQGTLFKEVHNFSGGLVNSLDNALMRDNQLSIFVNYDLDKNGDIDRRNGRTLHYIDDHSGQPIIALFPFFRGNSKSLLTIRKLDAYYGDDRDSLYVLTICDDALETCTTVVYRSYMPFDRFVPARFNVTRTTMNQGLVIAATQSEAIVFDSLRAIPFRPLTEQQPKAVPMSGDGNVDGTFRYKYSFRGTFLSNMSAPSWPVNVVFGKIVVFNIGPVLDSVTEPKAYLYREKNGDQKWELLDSVVLWESKAVTYLDVIAETVDADTTINRWGDNARGRPAGLRPDAPGALVVTLDTVETAGYGIGPIDTCGTFLACTSFVAYAMLYIDTLGSESFITPATFIQIDVQPNTVVLDFAYKAAIKGFAAPTDMIVDSAWLLRTVTHGSTQTILHDSIFEGDWFRHLLVDLAADSIVDSLVADTLKDDLQCAGFIEDVTELVFAFGEEPESTCYIGNLAIEFQPEAIVEHGFRLWAIDDGTAPNTVSFSNSGTIVKWSLSKQITIPSRDGDWFNNLASLGTNTLLATRQNSVVNFSGHSFFQLIINQKIRNVGLTAQRSLSQGRGRGTILYHDGLYEFGLDASVSPEPMTELIKNSIDSADTNIHRGFVGFVDDEMWLSLPINTSFNSHTYIYDRSPVPHWKSYDFGIKDMVQFEFDTTHREFKTGQWLFIADNDTIYRWNDNKDTAFDGGGADIIIARLQTKYFFDDYNREQIFYVDIFGEGTGDTLYVILDQDKGQIADTVPILLNFTDKKVDRARFNKICYNAAVGWYDNGLGDYKITGFRIGYVVKDKGRAP